MKQNPPVIAVSGIKNSGKTTFLEGLLSALQRRGVRTAVIKHDGHDFEPDVPGTDSFRMRKAGALGVAVYSRNHTMVIETRDKETEDKEAQQEGALEGEALVNKEAEDFAKPGAVEESRQRGEVQDPAKNERELSRLIDAFSDYDLILLEGQKYSDYPKIEIVRREISRETVCKAKTLLMVATDVEREELLIAGGCGEKKIPVIGLSEYEKAADFICLEYLK